MEEEKSMEHVKWTSKKHSQGFAVGKYRFKYEAYIFSFEDKEYKMPKGKLLALWRDGEILEKPNRDAVIVNIYVLLAYGAQSLKNP